MVKLGVRRREESRFERTIFVINDTHLFSAHSKDLPDHASTIASKLCLIFDLIYFWSIERYMVGNPGMAEPFVLIISGKNFYERNLFGKSNSL